MLRALFILLLLTGGVSYALPPEGFETFALLNEGNVTEYFAGEMQYQSPVFRNDFESANAIVGLPVGENLLSLGAKTMIMPKSGERSAYFARFDYTFGLQSFALKYIHEEWSYIATAKEVWSLDYNLFVPFGDKSAGFYMGLGYYYRWMKQRWNNDWGSPFSYDTQDRESFFEGVFGFKIPIFSDSNFATIDINWRDAFSYYNSDNVAFDLGLYFPGEGFLLRLNAGMRTSALVMGTGSPTDYYAGLGFQFF